MQHLQHQQHLEGPNTSNPYSAPNDNPETRGSYRAYSTRSWYLCTDWTSICQLRSTDSTGISTSPDTFRSNSSTNIRCSIGRRGLGNASNATRACTIARPIDWSLDPDYGRAFIPYSSIREWSTPAITIPTGWNTGSTCNVGCRRLAWQHGLQRRRQVDIQHGRGWTIPIYLYSDR